MSAEKDHPPGAEAGSDAPEAAESPTALAQGLPAVAPDLIEEIFADQIDNIVPTHGYHQMPVVALGGSAGSIQALKVFFQKLPAETGMAYVVILHLSPDHTSTLPELLQATTAMPVRAAQDAERLEANHVYVIPPGKHLLVVNGHLRLTTLEPERGKRVAVDVFFRTLADTHGPHATAVVLSGADSDGANGIKRIKERGGLTVAQDPEEAEHATMPRTAIGTGMVDWVLRVGDMPARIVEYRRNGAVLRLPSEDGPQPAKPAAPSPDDDEAALREVLTFLRARTSHDFSYYKRATIVRRIARRMQINGITNLPDYVGFTRTHPGEAGALLQDLLISVTNFFRDRDIFAALEKNIIPTLFEGKGPEDTVRVWCAACATGEEPYSMAMLLVEHARTLDHPPAIQVFACDLDEEAIQQARAGLYMFSIAADVSEERLQRFFVKDARGYRVRRELREMILFAEHDLLKDAPFSKLDLVSCRNLLIYLNREAQDRALEIFHFALKPEGKLLLGSSESVPEENDLFETLDKKNRFFVRRAVLRAGLPVPLGTGTLQRVLQAKDAPVLPGSIFSRAVAASFPSVAALPTSEERGSLTELHFRFIERCAPPSVMINEHHDIIHLSENAGRFLQPVGGQPTTNLLRSIHPALRAELRGALFEAVETKASVEIFGVPMVMEGVARMVDLRVASAAELAPGYLLVSFAARDPDAAAGSAASPRVETEAVVRRLEQEVEHVRGRLGDTVERYEAAAEEYKSSHEELQSMNEELRSASEELETSREELQSINEELTTVNLQLKSNVEELGHSNSDLQNLMNATSIITVFLDRELRITRFTPNAAELFFLIPTDVGRPLGHVKLRLDYPALIADAEKVLRTLVPVEREVDGTDDQHWFLVRLQPYRTTEDHIGGVVLTFVDITERRRAEEARRESEEKYRTLFSSMDQGYCIIQMLHDDAGKTVDFRFIEVNPAFEKHNGLTNATGKAIRELVPDIEDRWMEIYERVAASGESVRLEETSPALDGRAFDLYAFRVGDPAERKVAVLFTDISGRRSEAQRQIFRLKLSDALRPVADPAEVQQVAGRVLCEHLGVNRALYAEVDGEDWIIASPFEQNIPAMPRGRYPSSRFGQWIMEAYQQGEGIAFSDVQSDPRFGSSERAAHEAIHVRGSVGIPLVKGGKLVAALMMHSAEAREWTREEIALVEETAERTWAAVERARAEAEVRVSEKQQAFLLRLSDALRSLDDPLEIQRVAMRMLGQELDVTRAFYFLTEPEADGNWIHLIETDYLRDPGMSSHAGRHSVRDFGLGLFEGAEHGRIVAVEDVTKVALLTAAEVQKYLAVEVVAFINVPLIRNGRFVAGIGAHHPVPHVWNPEEIALIQEVASRVWASVEHARAEAALHASEAKLAVELADTQQLQRISSALVEEGNPDALDAQLLEAACALMRADFASLQIFVPDRNALRLLAHKGFAPELAKHWEWVRLDDTTSCGLAMTQEERTIVPDTERWECVAGTEDLAHFRLSGIRALQSTRLVSRGGGLVGMISTHWRDVHQPSERELGLFDVLARQAADLIERRSAGETLRASERRLRTLADAVPQIIWTNSGDGVADYFNKRWYEYSGLTYEQSHGLGWAAILHPDDAPRSVPTWEKALAAGGVFDTEYRLRRADGEYRWFIGRNVPLKDEAGRVLGWFGSSTDIHDLKLAEQALRESEAQFRSLAAATSDTVYRMSADWSEMRFLQGKRFLSDTPDPSGTWLETYIPPEDRSEVLTVIEAAIRHKQPFELEHRIIRSDGTVGWTFSRAIPLLDARGGISGWLGTASDMTERKRAEETLRHSEELFVALVENAPFGVYLIDAAFRLRTINAGSHAIFAGIEPLIGRDFAEILRILWAEPFASEAIARFRHTLETGESFVSPPIVEPRANIDEIQSYDWQLHRVALPDGSHGVVCYFYDLSAQKRLEAALAAAEERLRLIVESASEHAIISMDLERRVQSWNPGAEAIFGYSRDEMLDRSADLFFTPEDRAAGTPAREAATALETGRAGDNRWHLRKDGSRFWAEGAMLPMCAQPGGAVIGLVKILRDATPEREAREALERSQQDLWAALQETERARDEAESARTQAEAADAAKDHFLAVLSHELRTPLMPITMALATLDRLQDLPEFVRMAHAMIERNVALEAHFIDDLLDVTRIARGKMEIVRQDMDLHEAITRAVEVSSADVQAKGQQLTVSLEASEHRLSGDFARLQQAVWNLLKNASKFTPEAGEIHLRTRNDPGRQIIVVEVTDTGIGMDADAIARVFRPFEQADLDITRQYGGLGLGLAIAKGTVEAHGGELSASSPGRGQGATFTVSLPLTASVEEVERHAS